MIHRTTAIMMLLSLFLNLCSPSSSYALEDRKDTSPIALTLLGDGSKLLVANQTSGSVSLIETISGKVLQELVTGDMPSGVAASEDGRIAVVSHWRGYDVAFLSFSSNGMAVASRLEVGPEPRGVALDAEGKVAYVAVGASNEVVRIDTVSHKVTDRLSVGREPRGLALSPDGNRLVVANARGQSLSVINVKSFSLERTIEVGGDNLRQVVISEDGSTAYVAGMKNRRFPTTLNNIDLGWVLGQRVFRVALDGSKPADGLSLDPMGDAAGDAHGVGLAGGKGEMLLVSCGGTHELMMIRLDGKTLPWRGGVGRDVMADELVRDPSRFRRLRLGGRPTDLVVTRDGNTAYVANYLGNSIQQVEVESGKLVRTIELGAPEIVSLARRGEALFHDADRSANHWYSCNTCHSDGHTNGLDFDTMNDGWHDNSVVHARSRKKVPTLRRVAKTAPWTWHGWQESLDDAVSESFTKSMQGRRPSTDDVQAVVAFLETLDFPRNPNRQPDGKFSPEALRGEAVFRSRKAACSSCHKGPEFTDGKKHDIGLNERGDVYEGHNPPSLIGVYDKAPYLHDGRASDFKELLTKDHAPENLGGSSLSTTEIEDLIAYLKSL